MQQPIFITGGTGYIGSRLVKKLLSENNYRIKTLVRTGSEKKIPHGCEIVFGNALDSASYKNDIEKDSIFIHLIGVAHPSPAKKEAFKKIDLVSVQEAVKAAVFAGATHFIYLSVSQYPTNIMKDFQQVRAEGERLLKASGIKSSFVRPWYVLGPGHWWPLVLKPFFWLSKITGFKKEAAKNLDTVTIQQTIDTLIHAVQTLPASVNVYNVPDIKKIKKHQQAG